MPENQESPPGEAQPPEDAQARWPAWLAGLLVLLAAAVLLWQLQAISKRPPRSLIEKLADDRPVVLLSAGGSAELEAAPQDSWVLLALEVPDRRFRTYRVILLEATTRRQVWEAGALVLDVRGQLIFAVSGAAIPPGSYRAFVEGIKGADVARSVGHFPFRVLESP